MPPPVKDKEFNEGELGREIDIEQVYAKDCEPEEREGRLGTVMSKVEPDRCTSNLVGLG